MTHEPLMTRLLRLTVTVGTPIACVGFGLWLASMGASWYAAFAGGAVAGSLAVLIGRLWRDWPDVTCC